MPTDWAQFHRDVADQEARRDAALAANDAALTTAERKAIMSLHNLAKRWPKTLTLASMSGQLIVYRTDDPRFADFDSQARQEAVIQSFLGIPNEGGAW